MNRFKLWAGWDIETFRSFRVKLWLYLFDYERFNEKGYYENNFKMKIVWENDLAFVFEDGSFANKCCPFAFEIHEELDQLVQERDDVSKRLWNKAHPEKPI